ncbi:MAG: hypothetical protein A2W00_05960 [Candidatus Eisenbacteria bacterium RBG_16_71_46]|nr:MAG: hypothetical protein A2W00_05960 [Candidatus Eisenbacteria bacterium RBG_16_71_46]
MMPLIRRSALMVVLLSVAAGSAHADRRYFVQSYTPYLAPAGNLELEVFSIAASGQGDTTGTAWRNRIEFEYGIADRLTGAAYLNFVQPAGVDAPMTFDGPSLEFIYRLADPGKLPVDPAAYLEVRANGSELELEPKLLLARRVYQLVSVVNVVGEYERHNAGSDRGTTEKKLQLTAGVSREIGHVVAVGLEAVYARSFLADGPDASSFQLGPTINLQTPKLQLALGWQPQISGRPATNAGLNLSDFPRSEVRLIVGVEL